MFSPGLPDLFAVSSATSGAIPKILPKYNHHTRFKIPTRPLFDPNSKYPLAALVCTNYSDVKMIERVPGEVVQQRIPSYPRRHILMSCVFQYWAMQCHGQRP